VTQTNYLNSAVLLLVSVGLMPLILGGCVYQGYTRASYGAKAKRLAEQGHKPRVKVHVRRETSSGPLEVKYATYSRIDWDQKVDAKGRVGVTVTDNAGLYLGMAAPLALWGLLGFTALIFNDTGIPLSDMPWWVWGGVGGAVAAGGLVAIAVWSMPFEGSGPKVPGIQNKRKRSQAYGIHTTWRW
jgi:hypothetical protein